MPGAKRRSLETVKELELIYFDLDLQHVEESREEAIRRLQQLPVTWRFGRDSGSGNLHCGIALREPPARDTPEYSRVVAVWRRLAQKLCADMAPVHPAALIRYPGTHNTKDG